MGLQNDSCDQRKSQIGPRVPPDSWDMHRKDHLKATGANRGEEKSQSTETRRKSWRADGGVRKKTSCEGRKPGTELTQRGGSLTAETQLHLSPLWDRNLIQHLPLSPWVEILGGRGHLTGEEEGNGNRKVNWSNSISAFKYVVWNFSDNKPNALPVWFTYRMLILHLPIKRFH